jgi:hypothetical protein
MRPKKQIADTRTHLVTFRLTNPEDAKLKVLAERAGVVPNEMARILTTRSDAEINLTHSSRFDPALIKRLDQVGMDLKKLLQITQIDAATTTKIDTALAEIRQISKAAVEESVKE